MDVYFINFLKKHNSTAQPTISSLTPNSVKLKAPCSVLKPVLELYASDMSNYGTIISCNYAYISEFNRYYYITNWTFNDVTLVCSLEVDPLATYKSAITSSTQYVLRASGIYNSEVPDARYPVLSAMPTKSLTSYANPIQPSSGSDMGVIVTGIVSKGASTTGAVCYYVMTPLTYISFCLQMFNLTYQWGNDTSIADGAKKAISDPFQYVVSSMWLPFNTADFTSRYLVSSVSSITVGYDTINISGTAYFIDVLNAEFTNKIAFTIPKHPSAASRGAWLNVAPYSRYYLSFYPFCGEIEVDSMALQGKSTLNLVYTIDLRTGKGILSLCTEVSGTTYTDWRPSSPFRVIEAQVGVNIPTASIHTALPASLGQMARNAAISTVSQFGGFKETFLSIYSTAAKWVGGALGFSEEEMQGVYNEIGAEPIQGGDLSNIATNSAAMNSTAEMTGSQGVISFFNRMPLQFWGMFYAVANEGLTEYGRPLCEERSLSGLSGFVQCGSPHLATPSKALKAEVDIIEQYLASGILIQ